MKGNLALAGITIHTERERGRSTYIEELDRCVGMEATWARFAFHRSPTPGNYHDNDDDDDDDDGNADNDDVDNDDDDDDDHDDMMKAGYQSQISKSLSVLEDRSFLQIPTCHKLQ